MRSIVVDAASAGDTVTPDEINAEARETLGVLHSLDRDNFQAVLTREKVALGAINRLFVFGTEIEQTDTVEYVVSPIDIYPMPNDAGNRWIERISTGDAVLDITLSACWYMAPVGLTDHPAWLWIGIRVDGEMVVQTPFQNMGSTIDSSMSNGKVAVGAGEHVIEMVYGLVFSGSLVGDEVDILWYDRTVAIRELCR